MEPRHLLLSIYSKALQSVHGRQRVAAYLQQHPHPTPLALLAIGKAAPPMTRGAFDVLGSQITRALLITKKGHLDEQLLENQSVTCLQAAHPVPDVSSLVAGQAVLDFVSKLPPQYPLLSLISGGASALVEVPAPSITLADLQRVNHWLLASGLDIHAINQIRKSLSAIKGGRLASHLKGHPVVNLLISDVPGDDLSAIGSGILTYQESISLPPHLPKWLTKLTSQTLPLAKLSCFSKISQRIIASSATARQAASEAVHALGWPGYCHDDLIVGDAIQAGHWLGQQLRAAKPGVQIWSSETTVQLPKQPGQGGRCQSLALATALELAGQTGLYLLAAGSDGNDGMSEAAGALVDGNTLERGQDLDARQCLQQADAGRFLAASGDLIYSGPTGTNIMDILLGFRAPNRF